MPKPPVRRIPADTCKVTIGDAEYTPHEGEWVEIVGSPTIAEQREFAAMLAISGENSKIRERAEKEKRDLSEKEIEQLTKQRDEFDRQFDQFCERLGTCVVGWNLTDDRGREIPQPDGTEGPIRALRTEEVYFLWNAYRGTIEAERKNGSSGSDSGSTKAKSRNR